MKSGLWRAQWVVQLCNLQEKLVEPLILVIGQQEHRTSQVPEEMPLPSAKKRNFKFNFPPQSLHGAGLGKGGRINEVETVVDCQMLVALILQTVLSSPAVRYNRTWLNSVPDDRLQVMLVPLINRDHKTGASVATNSSKHPLALHNSANIILKFSKFRLVNFHYHSFASNSSLSFHTPLNQNLPAKTSPITD